MLWHKVDVDVAGTVGVLAFITQPLVLFGERRSIQEDELCVDWSGVRGQEID